MQKQPTLMGYGTYLRPLFLPQTSGHSSSFKNGRCLFCRRFSLPSSLLLEPIKLAQAPLIPYQRNYLTAFQNITYPCPSDKLDYLFITQCPMPMDLMSYPLLIPLE